MSEYRRVAWETYVTFCAPYDNVVPLLEEEYAHAVDALAQREDAEDRLRDPARQLADHLMALYWRGKLNLNDGGLLQRFFANASDELCGHAFEVLGRGIGQIEEPLTPEAVSRVLTLWVWRWDIIADAPEHHGEELAAFGWLFGYGKLPADWSLTQLDTVLRTVGKVEPNFMVGEMLAKLSVPHPLASVRCLALMVEGDRDGWLVLAIREHVRTVVTAALGSADPAAQQEAMRLVNRLGENGYHEYRDLLRR